MIYSSSRGHETDEAMEEVSSRTCDEECKKVSNSKGEKKLVDVQKITSEMAQEEAIWLATGMYYILITDVFLRMKDSMHGVIVVKD